METTVLNWIEQPAGMLACALLLLAGLMIPLFVKMARQKRFLENRM